MLNPTVEIPWEWTPRSLSVILFDTFSFDNGTVLPDGTYKLVTFALQPFGDPGNEGDWNSDVSVSFEIEKNTTASSASSF